MEQIIKFLQENTSGAFATVENGKPKVRPWALMTVHEDKFYFCTANTKDVYNQLKANPFMEFTATSKDMVTVRLSGEAVFTEDVKLKELVLEKNPGVKGIYKSAENPVFEIFYVEHGEAILSDFSGEPPRKFNF